MKKHMNMVELTKKQMSVVKAGGVCTKHNVECDCACPAGHCNPDLMGESDGGCMSPA